MFYLIAAILTSSAIFVTFKVFERWKIDTLTAITINYLVAAGLGFWLCADTADFSTILDQSWLLLALASGCLLMLTFLVYGTSVQKVGMAITSVAGKMSVVIPVLLGLLWFHESAGWSKIAGISVAMVAFFMALHKKESSALRSIYFYLPILLFFGNGANDALFKIAEKHYIADDFIFFLATAFAFSLILGIIASTVKTIKTRKGPDGRSILAGIILGLLNWYSTYFFLVGMRHFEVSLFIPVFNISIVVLAALFGMLFFKERLRVINWVGIALAIVAILFMAL